MPTYEYRCKDCGFEFEEFQSIVSDPLTVCPSCNGQINRVIAGGAGLIFKGNGFYLTDYKNANSSAATEKPTDTKKTADKAKNTDSSK